MKSYYLFAILLLSTCHQKKGVDKGIILFTHVGIVNHITNPLYISTAPIQVKLDSEQMVDLRSIGGDTAPITEKKKGEYINAKFDRIVTDSVSFYQLSLFILNNNKFYTSSSKKNSNPAAESYAININGQKFSIYYKLKNDFFNQLNAYLIKKNADPKLINELSYLK